VSLTDPFPFLVWVRWPQAFWIYLDLLSITLEASQRRQWLVWAQKQGVEVLMHWNPCVSVDLLRFDLNTDVFRLLA